VFDASHGLWLIVVMWILRLIVAIMLFASSCTALACSCEQSEVKVSEYLDNKFVFYGYAGEASWDGDKAKTTFTKVTFLTANSASDITLSHRHNSASCGITFQMGIPYFLVVQKDVEGNLWTDQCLNTHVHPSVIINYLVHGVDAFVPSRNDCYLLESVTSEKFLSEMNNIHGLSKQMCKFYDSDNSIRLYRTWKKYQTQEGVDLMLWH